MWSKSSLIFGLMTVVTISTFTSLFVFAEDSVIPEWVKNNAKWWSEGQIAEADFISALQYLINQGIITIPITEVTAAKVSLSDSERAQSYVVHIKGERIGATDVGATFHTFSEFRHLSDTIDTSFAGTIDVGGGPMFYLMGLPSHDKNSLYQVLDEYFNYHFFPDKYDPPEVFSVKVDILAGDGTIIQTWDYIECDIIEYTTFLDSDKATYRFGEKDEAEIREFLLWECSRFNLIVP